MVNFLKLWAVYAFIAGGFVFALIVVPTVLATSRGWSWTLLYVFALSTAAVALAHSLEAQG